MFNLVICRSWSSLDDFGDLVCFLSLFEGFETYIWMFLHHTVFTNIDSMFKTKLIRDSTFWTFAQSHFLCFLYFADFFFVCLLFHLCDVTQFWQFSAGKQSEIKTIQKLIINSINFFPVQNSTFFLILINTKILISEINWILWINLIYWDLEQKSKEKLPKINQNKLLLWLAVNLTEKFWNLQNSILLIN